MYNAAMKKGILKEEKVPKISIISKRAEDTEDLKKLIRLLTKKKRMGIN